ncbi:MAG: hypothetical protein KDA24_20950 [Deltaproteobacteria bacterium]|nr:hypothetical protein [Deltaproteobacteria bacterium]
MRAWFMVLSMLLVLPGCPTGGSGDDDDASANDDDSSVSDDDDVADDDDATADDDDVADDDDSAPPGDCPVLGALGDIDNWSRILGCAAVTFSAGPAEDTVRLGVQAILPPDAAGSVGASYSLYFTDIDAKDEVEGGLVMEQGSNLSTAICNDTPGSEQIKAIWNPVMGRVGITVTGSGEGGGFFATIQTVGVTVEEEEPGNAQCRIPDRSWEDVRLGWLP